MLEDRPVLTAIAGRDEQREDKLQAELAALKYENQKLKAINRVLVQRVELGWGNFSTAYSSFERAAMLTEQVASKAKALQQTRSKLDDTELSLSQTAFERDVSQQRLFDLVGTIPDAVALFDSERTLVIANASFYHFWCGTGAVIQPGETKLASLSRLAVNHGLFDPAARGYARTRAGEGPADVSIFKLADGRWLQMTERQTADGGLVVVYTDVSAVKQQETADRLSIDNTQDELLQDMLENLPQGVVVVDCHRRVRACNQKFRSRLSTQYQQGIRGASIETLIEGSLLESAVEQLTDLWCGCDPSQAGCQRELYVPKLDIVLDVRSHPLVDGGFVLTFTDITKRSRDAQALREGAHRLRLMTDALPALIAFYNADEICEFANRTFVEWYDLPRDRLEGSTLRTIMGPHEYTEHRKQIGRALNGQPVSFEVEQVLPDGRQRIFAKSFVPNRSNDGGIVGFFALEQDVTEQRRTASALKHAYRHMEQRVFERTRELSLLNEKLQDEVRERALIEQHLLKATHDAEMASESKVKFMAAAGHDLLQPLNAARLFTTAMLDEPLGAKAERLAASLSRSLEDVESIITTLVDISKLEAGVVEAACEPFVVDELLSALAEEFSALAAEEQLDFHYVRCTAVVNSDSQLLARVLRNLLTNALRYTEQGKIVLGCRRRPTGLDIEVGDTGIGIEEDQLHLIFEEFQRAAGGRLRDERGLGLGLAIVDKLTGVLGCSVSVRSLPSCGSVFTVHVPYGELAAPPAPVTDPSMLPKLMSFQGARVIVVDNDPSILEGMETLLEQWDVEVACARCLDEVDEILSSEFTPSVALLDYQLDDGNDGFALAEYLRDRLGRDFAAILITANYSRELHIQAAESGIPLLNKPVRPLKLRSLLGRLLTQSA